MTSSRQQLPSSIAASFRSSPKMSPGQLSADTEDDVDVGNGGDEDNEEEISGDEGNGSCWLNLFLLSLNFILKQ